MLRHAPTWQWHMHPSGIWWAYTVITVCNFYETEQSNPVLLTHSRRVLTTHKETHRHPHHLTQTASMNTTGMHARSALLGQALAAPHSALQGQARAALRPARRAAAFRPQAAAQTEEKVNVRRPREENVAGGWWVDHTCIGAFAGPCEGVWEVARIGHAHSSLPCLVLCSLRAFWLGSAGVSLTLLVHARLCICTIACFLHADSLFLINCGCFSL